MKTKSMSERLKEQIKKEAYSTVEVYKVKTEIAKKIEEIIDVDNGSLQKLSEDIYGLKRILDNKKYTSDKIDEATKLIDKLENLLNDWSEKYDEDITTIEDSIKPIQTKWDSSRPFGK